MSNLPVTSSVLKNIRKIRGLRDYSQEYMGQKLGMSARGYGGIETGETPLTMERLEKIAEILEVDVPQLLSFDEKMLFYNCQYSGNLYNNTFNGYSKEVVEKMLEQKDGEISYLKQQIEKLHKIIDKLGGQ